MQPGPPVTAPTVQGLTPRQATWLTLRRPTERTKQAQALRTRLPDAHATCTQAIMLAQDCAQRLRARPPAPLDPWLPQAATSGLAALRRLAHSGQRDYAAVKAGLPLPWSSGPGAGHINRLKMLQRHMYGRARLALLRRRFVRAPQQGKTQAPGQPGPAQTSQEAIAA